MSDQPSWPSNDEGSQPPPPNSGQAPPPPPPPAQGSGAPPQYQQNPSDQQWGGQQDQWGQQPGYGAQPTAATYGVRLGARLLDGLVLLIPNIILAFLVGGGSAQLAGATSVRSWFAGALGTLLSFGYYVYLESNNGQTLGKKWLNLRVIGTSGGNPTTEEAAKRNAFSLIGLIPTALGGLLAFGAAIAIPITGSSDPYKRGWHDKFAGGTTVVKTG